MKNIECTPAVNAQLCRKCIFDTCFLVSVRQSKFMHTRIFHAKVCEHSLQVFSYPVDFVSAFMLCYTQDDTHTEGIERFDVISMKATFFSSLICLKIGHFILVLRVIFCR
jgi:hypothetical protein